MASNRMRVIMCPSKYDVPNNLGANFQIQVTSNKCKVLSIFYRLNRPCGEFLSAH